MVHYYHSLSIDATIMVSKHCPITGEHVGIIFVTQYVTMATLLPAKNTLIFSFKRLYFKNGTVKFFLNIKFLNPMYRIFLNFAKSCVLSCLLNGDNIKKFHRAVFEL